ncbi:hypothetical protein M441DRAFT_51663 [Trichoderma asperellum CBS 433.97]|uniref:Uncharacterized protein n=1 Tax=Trichoderma asperellum (strain ATCC 204424 / CBS 433.97 / NBRC 101777) TaxID=1042311 RepID=A0A2T3YTY4_TRIA4|nr:hypothetical protein M441DRAFT_51663 [Trichoderma asperellum CBS 433.97]PTB35989.1 hypothetical protein M441DRAFT_51663 [Trichoderma asperellum CBS 433.97]
MLGIRVHIPGCRQVLHGPCRTVPQLTAGLRLQSGPPNAMESLLLLVESAYGDPDPIIGAARIPYSVLVYDSPAMDPLPAPDFYVPASGLARTASHHPRYQHRWIGY